MLHCCVFLFRLLLNDNHLFPLFIVYTAFIPRSSFLATMIMTRNVLFFVHLPMILRRTDLPGGFFCADSRIKHTCTQVAFRQGDLRETVTCGG